MERAEQLARFYQQTLQETLRKRYPDDDPPLPFDLLVDPMREAMIESFQVILDREEAAEDDHVAMQEARAEARQRITERGITPDDFHGWLLTKVAAGWPEGYLLKCAVISLNALMRAGDRWQRLEGGRSASAPLWLDTNERDTLVAALRGQKGTTLRVLRQSLQEMM